MNDNIPHYGKNTIFNKDKEKMYSENEVKKLCSSILFDYVNGNNGLQGGYSNEKTENWIKQNLK